MSHRFLVRCLVAAGCSAVAVLSGAPPARAQGLQISPNLPGDIGSGASSATLAEASTFAWQEFIALNWPAAQLNGTVQRGQADMGAKFGQAGASPLVWESYRQKVEIFPGANNAVPPHGADRPGTPQDPYNYSDPPLYLYSGGTIPNGGVVDACPGQEPVAQPAWVNLDETSQIGLDQMFAGIVDVPAATQPNTAPQLIRFLAKANQAEYDYIVGNKLWFTTSDAYTSRITAWQAALGNGQPPDPNSVITLPAGTVEVKAAWRPLAKGEDPSHFHMATVRYYEPAADGSPCYREDQWALAGLHIIQKTPSAPYFIFATFEQAGNVVTADGVATEDANGKVVIPTAGPNTPALVYTDDPNTPTVATNPANTFCDTPGKRLYYQEQPAGTPPNGTPVGGNICVDARYEAIPPVVQAANSTFHGLISAYNAQNNLNSPWLYYKLISVQAVPLNLADISTDPDSTRQIGSFYQANIVVETDYTLQQFLARIAADQAPTRYPSHGTSQNFQNVYVAAGSQFTTYQMGGCMGCHGNAQVGGTDFSFIVGGNAFNTTPDVPAPSAVKQALYLSLFGNPLPADLKK